MNAPASMTCALCRAAIPAFGEMAFGNGGAYCMACWNTRRGECMSLDQAATRAGDERVARLNREVVAFSDGVLSTEEIEAAKACDPTNDDIELTYWRSVLGPRALALVERALAAQGDAAEASLVKLQHDLRETLNSYHVQK